MDMRVNDLNYLSRKVHAEASVRQEKIPAEWPEFYHLPMDLTREGPVFDGSRMRPDQIEDAIAALERYLGLRERASDPFTAVKNYMEAYGMTGLRASDVAEGAQVSKPTALKYLRAMISGGTVTVTDEPTRGSGSRRKRYFLAESAPVYEEAQVDGTDLYSDTDGTGNEDTGIRYHGTAVQGVTCGCGACQWAAEEAIVGQLRSHARERGDRAGAFQAGLELRRIRRERQEAEDRRHIEERHANFFAHYGTTVGGTGGSR